MQEKGDNEINLQLAEELVAYILEMTTEGAILVFLTGWEDITLMQRRIERRYSPTQVAVFPLHSEIPTQVLNSHNHRNQKWEDHLYDYFLPIVILMFF